MPITEHQRAQIGFAFDPESHTYTLDGRTIPGVTDVLKAEGFIDTSNPWYTDWHRDRGHYVHEAIALDVQGELDADTLDPAIEGLVASARRYWSALPDLRIAAIEEPIHHPVHQYGGTLDLAIAGGHRDSIIDWKAGGPERWHGLQLAAYEEIWWATRGKLCNRFTVHLDADGGTPRCVEHTHPADRGTFLAALACYRWKQSNR